MLITVIDGFMEYLLCVLAVLQHFFIQNKDRVWSQSCTKNMDPKIIMHAYANSLSSIMFLVFKFVVCSPTITAIEMIHEGFR